MHLILYSKVGCHLCEGLQEKLEQITELDIQLEIREITTNPEWFDRYQYEIPVLMESNNPFLVFRLVLEYLKCNKIYSNIPEMGEN
jgi:Glutaredoxin-like domain (DUF836)